MQLEDIKSIFTRVREKDPALTWVEAMPILLGWIRTNGMSTRALSNGTRNFRGERVHPDVVFAEDTLMELAKFLDKSKT
tara:strand:+ start:1199 stop:1435 length:237 start_codon:yes stop_codon:yes gene_type:complete